MVSAGSPPAIGGGVDSILAVVVILVVVGALIWKMTN